MAVGTHPAPPVLPPPHPLGFLIACGCRGLVLAHVIGAEEGGKQAVTGAACSTVTDEGKGTRQRFQPLWQLLPTQASQPGQLESTVHRSAFTAGPAQAAALCSEVELWH